MVGMHVVWAILAPSWPPSWPRPLLLTAVGMNVVGAILALMVGNPNRIFSVVVWSVFVYWLYSQLIKKKNWARLALVVVTFPWGLFVGLSREVKLYCLQQGTTIVKPDVKAGNTELIVCASEGDIEKAKLLLANGADINARNEQGGTALLIAVLNNHPSMVSLLLNHGADASIASNKGLTAKALATNKKYTAILQLLSAGKSSASAKTI